MAALGDPAHSELSERSAELLGQRDDDTFGAAQVAEQEDVLVPDHLADEFGAAGPPPGDRVFDVVDGEHGTTDTQCVRRCVSLEADHRRLLVAHQLELAVAVRSPHHRHVDALTVEPDDAVRPLALHGHPAFQLEAKFEEEGDGGVEVVEDNAALSGNDLSVPDRVDVEVVSVLRRRWLAKTMTARRFACAVGDLARVPADRYPSLPFMQRAYELRSNVSPYDATYVALAEQLGCVLITADAKLARAHGLRCPITVL